MDAIVKKVMVLDVTSGSVKTFEQFLVKIGHTLISRHADEASAVTAMNEANTARQRFRASVKKA